MDEERVERLAALAQQLDGLASHTAWPILRDEVEGRMRKDMLRFASPTAPDVREFDWKRGFWAGALYVLNIPENAQDTFEQALKRAEAIGGGSE